MVESVRLEVAEGVGTIRIDRPPANAIDEGVSKGLRAAAGEASERDDVRAVVVWGGDRLFAAGADIKVMANFSPAEVRPVVMALAGALDAVEAIPKVVIGAINGFALGGGCELALACDFRYAAEDAQLGQPEIGLGIIPGAGGTQRLPRLIGPAMAKDLIYSGRRVGADEARAIGLVDRVFPAADAYKRALEDARRYAMGPSRALSAAKAAVNEGVKGDLRAGMALELDRFCELFGTEDQREGMGAFLGKRAPRFKGR